VCRSTPTTTRASISGSAPIRRCAGGSITTPRRSSRPGDTARYIGWLSQAALAEVAARPEIASELAVVEAERARELAALQGLGVWHGDVVVFDRFAESGARSPGFLTYLMYPACLYSVSGIHTPQSIKISVGVNPWTDKPRRHDIGELCARHGGGGHAAVGGVTLRPEELARARQTMDAIVRELADT
jgi:hypothetical protein